MKLLVVSAAIASLFLQLDALEPVSYFISDGRGIPGYQPHDPDLARLALEAWSRESDGRIRFTAARDEKSARIRVRWIPSDAGMFGETARLLVNGKPGAVVYVMPDASQLGRDIAARAEKDGLYRDTIVYLTCVHELGHAVGLPHTSAFEDIMYTFGFGGDLVEYFNRYRRKLKSRSDIERHSGLSPGDVRALRALFKP